MHRSVPSSHRSQPYWLPPFSLTIVRNWMELVPSKVIINYEISFFIDEIWMWYLRSNTGYRYHSNHSFGNWVNGNFGDKVPEEEGTSTSKRPWVASRAGSFRGRGRGKKIERNRFFFVLLENMQMNMVL